MQIAPFFRRLENKSAHQKDHEENKECDDDKVDKLFHDKSPVFRESYHSLACSGLCILLVTVGLKNQIERAARLDQRERDAEVFDPFFNNLCAEFRYHVE